MHCTCYIETRPLLLPPSNALCHVDILFDELCSVCGNLQTGAWLKSPIIPDSETEPARDSTDAVGAAGSQ
jgi:hypothetical protein